MPTEPARIREAVPDDAPALAALHIGAWQSAYRGLVPDTVLDGLSIERRTAWWRERLGPGKTGRDRTWVVEDDRGLAGFATGGDARNESAPPPPGAGEIHEEVPVPIVRYRLDEPAPGTA